MEGCGGLGRGVFTCLGVALQHEMCSVKHEASYVPQKVNLLEVVKPFTRGWTALYHRYNRLRHPKHDTPVLTRWTFSL